MSESSGSDKKIEGVLNSLDGIQRAKASPFLYTRIRAKLDSSLGAWEKIAGLMGRPAFAFSIILILLFINIGAVVRYEQIHNAISKDSEQAFGVEYATGDFTPITSNTDH